jgi:hypothetical protein
MLSFPPALQVDILVADGSQDAVQSKLVAGYDRQEGNDYPIFVEVIYKAAYITCCLSLLSSFPFSPFFISSPFFSIIQFVACCDSVLQAKMSQYV